jgi:D-3-phosphoglycerate dehydrogenase / 2-oxoglutarate reductase
MHPRRVLITDDCHPKLIEGLELMGYACDFEPDITLAAARTRIGDYRGLVINSKILVDRQFLDAATQLRFVARLGSGMEIVDRTYAAECGVAVISSPEGNRNAVAEQALGMLLMLANNLLRADREVRHDIWQRETNRGWELEGKTIGIVGCGHTGGQLVRKLAGLGMQVLTYDKYLPAGYAAEWPWVNEVNELADLQAQADIISLHLPLTDETRHLVNRHFLDNCKADLVLVNTSRGHCIRTEDVVEALENGRIKGACLDVFENEKVATRTPDEQVLYARLHRLNQVVLAPHIAGWTHESKRKMAEVLLDRIALLDT